MQLLQSNSMKTLTSLALMETELLSDDYLSTFLPFIATLSINKKYSTIDIGIVISDFKDEYGISIPRAPMQSILSKATNRDLISRAPNGTFLPVFSEMQKLSFATQQGMHSKELDVLLNSFIDYVQVQHNIALQQNEAVDILIAFLDEYSPRTVSGEYFNRMSEWAASDRNLFLMGTFIQSAAQNNASLFEYIRKLSMAHLIATALTFDEPVEQRLTEFSDLTLYLDTPVILRLLGLQSEELELSYGELFKNFKDTIHPTYMIFQHTLDEITGIIEDCVNWIENPEYNPAYANPALLSFVKRNFTKTQVELYKTSLGDRLGDWGISVDDREYYHIVHRTAQIDISRLKEKLIEAYEKNNPSYNAEKNQHSIEYDLKSIDYIVKLWGTKSSNSYSRLGYLFITSNATLAYVCRKFTSTYWWDSKNHKMPCMTDYYLGTMVWLCTPSSRMENVSKLKLIADCSAATSLSNSIMERFSASLEMLRKTKGIKDGDYLLLRNNAFEKNYLQSRTLNEETAFTDDTLDQVLEDIKADLQRPLLESISNKDSQLNQLREEIDVQHQIIEIFQQKTEADQREIAIKNQTLEKRATKTAERIINTFGPIFFAFFGFIAGVLQFVPAFFQLHPVFKLIAIIISFCAAVLFGVLKSNLLKTKDKLVVILKKRYQVNLFKKNLK